MNSTEQQSPIIQVEGSGTFPIDVGGESHYIESFEPFAGCARQKAKSRSIA
jgi:hypothetical protein